MKIIVCGGRDYGDYHALRQAIERLAPTHIAHGAEKKGADPLTDEIATHLRIPVQRFPANWNQFGKPAGMIRNGRMLKQFAPDALLAAPGAKGTANMIIRCLKVDLPVYAIDQKRELVRLPQLERSRSNQPYVPRDIEPTKIVERLLARARPYDPRVHQNNPARPQEQNHAFGQPPYLDCTRYTNSPLSPRRARLNSHDGRTVYEIYTAAKIFENGDTGLTPEQAKGREELNPDQSAAAFRAAYQLYLQENPALLETLLKAPGVANLDATQNEPCAAKTLWYLRQEEIKRRHQRGLPVPTRNPSRPARFNTAAQDPEPEIGMD